MMTNDDPCRKPGVENPSHGGGVRVFRASSSSSLCLLQVLALCLVILLLVGARIAEAEIYKWVDSDGKVRFSDKPPVEQHTSGVQEMDLAEQRFNTNRVGSGDAIPYQGKKSSRLVQLDLPIRAVLPKQFIGTLGAGATCREVRKIEINRESIVAGETQDDLVVDFFRRVNELGYNISEVEEEHVDSLIRPTRSGVNSIVLEPTIRDIEVDLCGEASHFVGEVFSRTTVNLAVDWKVLEPRTRSVLYNVTTTGYYRDGEMQPLTTGTDRAMVRAFAMATNELFSEPEFVDLLNPQSEKAQRLLATMIEQYEDAELAPVLLSYKRKYIDYFDSFDLVQVAHLLCKIRDG